MILTRIHVMFLLIIFISCASSPNIGYIKMIESSSNKLKWVKDDKDYKVDDGIMYFRSFVMDRKNLAFAKREAKAEALKNIAEKINIRVRTEFKQATKGSNIQEEGLSQFSSDAISWVSENLNIQGISPSRIYWEKYQKLTERGYDYFYNFYVLVELPEKDYFMARDAAIRGLTKRYHNDRNQSAQIVADEIQKRLLKKEGKR